MSLMRRLLARWWGTPPAPTVVTPKSAQPDFSWMDDLKPCPVCGKSEPVYGWFEFKGRWHGGLSCGACNFDIDETAHVDTWEGFASEGEMAKAMAAAWNAFEPRTPHPPHPRSPQHDA